MGCPCDDDLSCESGACAATDGGRICVDPCVDSCPAGFECTRAGTGPDEVFLCLPRFAKLCQPCNDHNDCEVVEANRPARCITNGTQGSFCGAGCVADGDCPDGYLCEERNVGLRALESQCVPADGVCSCNAIGAAQGMGTRCERSNEIGTCSGMRKCTEEGLSECSAIFAEEERCDGMDNDCNGEIDDVGANRPCSVANEHGVCEGKATCYGGRELCDAPEPQAEVCDGVDSDCDGQTDEGTCDDGVSCTMDSCNAAAGQCVQTPMPELCDDANECTEDHCDGRLGCVHEPRPGHPCDDGSHCTDDDTCRGATCEGVARPGCCAANEDCDDGNECTLEACDTATGACVFERDRMEGLPCDADGDGCTVGDQCSGAVCLPGLPADCPDDASGCTVLGCVSTAHDEYRCESTPRPAGTVCSDGDACTSGDTCDGAGACVGGAVDADCCHDDAACDDLNPCTEDRCDPELARCAHDPVEDGARCDADGDGCTTGDSCSAGVCTPGTHADCGPGDDPCRPESCVSQGPDSYRCDVSAFAVGEPCDDRNPCTSGSACDSAGECTGGTERDCQAEAGGTCLRAFCDPLDGGCVSVTADDGTWCDDGEPCTMDDLCVVGSCMGGRDVCVAERISTGPYAGEPPRLASLGGGRYVTLWQGTPTIPFVRLRRTADDGSREDEEELVDRGDGNAFGTRIAVDASGRYLVALRSSVNASVRLYDRAGRLVAQNSFPLPAPEGQSPPGNGENGALIPLVFSDGSWGLVSTYSIGKDAKTVIVLMGDDLVPGAPVDLGIDYWNGKPNYMDAVVSSDGQSFWVVSVTGVTIVKVQRFAQNGTALSGPYSGGKSQATRGVGIAALPGNAAVFVWSTCGTAAEPCWHKTYGTVLGSDGKLKHFVHVTPTSATVKHRYPRVDSFSDGTFVMVYQDDTQSEDTSVVVVELYSSSGQLLSEDEVSVDWSGVQLTPDVAVLSETDYVVALRDGAGHVWTRRMRRDGVPWTGRVERGVDANSGFSQRAPSAGSTKAGDVLVAWEGPNVPGGDEDILARLFDAAGVPKGDAVNLSGNDNIRQAHPSVAGHDDGFVVVWDERDESGSPKTVGARLDAAARVVQGPFVVQEESYAIERRSHVDARPDGSFVVAWTAHSQGKPYGLARAFGADGQARGPASVVVDPHEAGNEGTLHVAAHPTRDEVVVAHDFVHGGETLMRLTRFNAHLQPVAGPVSLGSIFGSYHSVDVGENDRVVACWVLEDATVDLYCQIFDYEALTPIGDRFAAPGDAKSNQTSPRVAWMPDGTFAAAWTDSEADGDGSALLVRAFNGAGAPRDPRRTANRSWTGDQSLGFFLPVGLNRLWVGWTDTGLGPDRPQVRYRVLQRF